MEEPAFAVTFAVAVISRVGVKRRATGATALPKTGAPTGGLLGTFVEEDEEHFETAIVDIDNRVLQTVKAFFDIVSKDSATLRIISGESERTFDLTGIVRATERIKAVQQDATEALSYE